MTLTELRYIVALSETGHFRRAAEQCNVSQPTLSIAVKKLEEELGISLFERARHKVSTTPVGERIIDQVSTERNASVKLPDEKAGILMVFRTFDKVSFGLVMKATSALHVGDIVRTP